jgi:hypothetical protein
VGLRQKWQAVVCLLWANVSLGFWAGPGGIGGYQGSPAPSAPVRLAVICEEPAGEPAADLLTAQLSRRPDLFLLERAEIHRILEEQRNFSLRCSSWLRQ